MGNWRIFESFDSLFSGKLLTLGGLHLSERNKRSMPRLRKYPFAARTRKLCAFLKISPERVLERAGLHLEALENEGKGATADIIHKIWEAVVAEANVPNLPLLLGKVAARGAFIPAVFAFACSRNIRCGLERLALFKPLVGPIVFTVNSTPMGLYLDITSPDEDAPMPADFASMECVYFVELCRVLTAEHIVPKSISLPGDLKDFASLEEFFGISVKKGKQASLMLSPEDARRPLLSADPETLVGIEKELQRQLRKINHSRTMEGRVKDALLELLPSGKVTADAVSDYLNVSKRTLYRYLQEEDTTFQSVLDATRSELSLHYLSKGDVSVEEISYLLAFRAPNSFYRAFRGWTGMTPAEARDKNPLISKDLLA